MAKKLVFITEEQAPSATKFRICHWFDTEAFETVYGIEAYVSNSTSKKWAVVAYRDDIEGPYRPRLFREEPLALEKMKSYQEQANVAESDTEV